MIEVKNPKCLILESYKSPDMTQNTQRLYLIFVIYIFFSTGKVVSNNFINTLMYIQDKENNI